MVARVCDEYTSVISITLCGVDGAGVSSYVVRAMRYVCVANVVFGIWCSWSSLRSIIVRNLVHVVVSKNNKAHFCSRCERLSLGFVALFLQY